jgi:hypothetical protein
MPKRAKEVNVKNLDKVSLREDTNTNNQDINENQAKINQSGNSNVNVNVTVEVDTKAIAYALLCSSLAKKEMTNEEFEFALQKLEQLTKNDQKDKNNKNDSQWNKLVFFR